MSQETLKVMTWNVQGETTWKPETIEQKRQASEVERLKVWRKSNQKPR